MGENETQEKTAEELEREANEPDKAEPVSTTRVTDVLERESEPLREGNAIDSPLGPLPVRSLAGMALMIAIGVAVYLIAWSVFGTLGLLLGWIPAAALGLLAAREYGRRAAT
jgi:hypothetical protein